MTKTLKPLVSLSVVLLVSGGIACKPKPVKTAPEAPPAPVATPAPPTEVRAPEDFKPKPEEAKIETLPGDVMAINKAGYLKDVFFDFDKAEIRQDQRDALDRDAQWLKKYPTVKFRIEGHCDERGTAQYNMALGERRASAARDFLVSLGVESARIEIVSYGKERPFALGHDESAWAQNRRGHFVVTAK